MSNKKINLIHIITALDYGGAERLLFDLVRNLDRKKYNVSVVCVVRGGALVKEFRDIAVDVKIIGKKIKIGLSTIFKISKYLKRKNPDIVHTHLFGGDTWGRLGALMARVPVIISTEHNINLDEGIIKRFVKMVLSWFTDKIIAVSSSVKEYSIKVDHINPKKIEVIYNGVNIKKFYNPNPNFFQNKTPVIGVVGRLEEQKGHKYLLEAIQKIKDVPFEVWVIGDGSLRIKLEKQADELSIKDKVKFLGSRDDVKELLRQTDIFVLPSLWEGLGIAVLEAALAGKPIIATKVGGLQEIINDKKTGLLIPAKDSEKLAQSIKWVLSHEKEAAQMALKLQEEVREQFDVKKMAKKYENLYLN